MLSSTFAVMPGLVPGIHVLVATKKDVDGRDKCPGHDAAEHFAFRVGLRTPEPLAYQALTRRLEHQP
jgi:hypothetical protein